MLKKFLSCSLLATCTLQAATVVVSDSGKTIDIGEYYTKSAIEPSEPYTMNDLKADIKAEFPLVSTIRMGRSYKKRVDINGGMQLPANIVLTGTDDKSKAWIKAKYNEIKNASAIVIVIDVKDLNAYKAFESALVRAGLQVTKSNSKPFERLIDAYPVLIKNGEVIQ